MGKLSHNRGQGIIPGLFKKYKDIGADVFDPAMAGVHVDRIGALLAGLQSEFKDYG